MCVLPITTSFFRTKCIRVSSLCTGQVWGCVRPACSVDYSIGFMFAIISYVEHSMSTISSHVPFQCIAYPLVLPSSQGTSMAWRSPILTRVWSFRIAVMFTFHVLLQYSSEDVDIKQFQVVVGVRIVAFPHFGENTFGALVDETTLLRYTKRFCFAPFPNPESYDQDPWFGVRASRCHQRKGCVWEKMS